MPVTILDGALGTELNARGVETPLPGWTAHALDAAADVLAAIHRDYAAAGAAVHSTNTFRTQPRVFPHDWARLARHAAEICRRALPAECRVAGSIGPLEDCYRPDLSPAPDAARTGHAALAPVLADAGCDLLFLETFPHAGEALIALDAALETGLPVWISLTPGPDGSLLTPRGVAAGAAQAARRGAAAVLVNCLPAARASEWVRALADAAGATPFGVYANAGHAEEGLGWGRPDAPRRYADLAGEWVALGASIVGGCCGTGPAHIAELTRRFAGRPLSP